MWELGKDLLLVSLGMGIGVVLMCIKASAKKLTNLWKKSKKTKKVRTIK